MWGQRTHNRGFDGESVQRLGSRGRDRLSGRCKISIECVPNDGWTMAWTSIRRSQKRGRSRRGVLYTTRSTHLKATAVLGNFD